MDLELTTSITNLIMGGMGITALIITLLIRTSHTTHKSLCIRTLLAFTCSSFLGYINHSAVQSVWETLILWALLYAAMFECVRLCMMIIMDSRFGESRPTHQEKLFMLIPEIILYVGALAIRPTNAIVSMLFFLVYGSVATIICLYHTIRLLAAGNTCGRFEAIFILIAFILTIPAIVFQYCKKGSIPVLWCFDYNGVSHLLLCLSFLFMILGIIASLRIPVKNLIIDEIHQIADDTCLIMDELHQIACDEAIESDCQS